MSVDLLLFDYRGFPCCTHLFIGCNISLTCTTLFLDLAYARSYLPALAALMMSGHIKTGDSIDLPMPHPEAWSQTLAYVYTGSGEVSEAARQNILHLGGRV